MSTGKLIVLTIGWILASVTIGVVTGIFLTEILSLVGVVGSGTSEYSLSLNIIALVTFVVVVTIPLVFRKRFVAQDDGDV